MAARVATCAASASASAAAASCSYMPSPAPASCRKSSRCGSAWRSGVTVVCIARERENSSGCSSYQVAGLSSSWRPRSSGFGGSTASSRISARNVVCEVAVEIGGARSHKEEPVGVGARVRVKGPLKVYHVKQFPDLDLDGLEGEVKDVLGEWKGKPVSANLPFKVQFVLEAEGKPVKFFAHLRDGEFEVVDAVAN